MGSSVRLAPCFVTDAIGISDDVVFLPLAGISAAVVVAGVASGELVITTLCFLGAAADGECAGFPEKDDDRLSFDDELNRRKG